MIEYYPSIDGNDGTRNEPHEDTMENVLDLLKLTSPPAITEGSLDDSDTLSRLSEEIIDDLARDVRSLLVHHGFKDAGMFDSQDVAHLGFDICSDARMLEKLIENAKSSANGKNVGVLDLINARDEADYKLIQRDLTHTAYGLLRWLEIIDDEELYNIRYFGNPNDQRSLQKFARLIVSPAMTSLLGAMQTTAERSGQKFKLQQAMALAWNRARALDREQAALDEGDSDAIERRRRFLDSPEMEEVRSEFYIRQEHETDRLSQDIPPPDEV